jgi:hypothetical protein
MLVGLMFLVMTALILVAAWPSMTQTPGGVGLDHRGDSRCAVAVWARRVLKPERVRL